MNTWLIALIALGGGFALATILAPITRRLLSKPSRPEAIRQIAPVAGTFVFSLFVAVGLLVAVSMVDPTNLKKLPNDVVNYFPKVLAAGLIVIIGNVLASIAALSVKQSAIRATGDDRPTITRMTKAVVMSAAGILAVSQLGINTTIINLAVAALLFSVGATVTLLVGLGGRDVAQQVGAGRYIQRILQPGQHITVADISGDVVALHAATVEVRTATGSTVHIPHVKILQSPVEIVVDPGTPPVSSPHAPSADGKVDGDGDGDGDSGGD